MFAGAGAAVAGSTPRALAIARELAARLGMRAATVADEDRAAYHAAASIASNFLDDARGRRRAAGGHRRASTASCWRRWCAPRSSTGSQLGAGPALTGPIARGDEATVARQRAAVQERTPDLLALFDALADATRALAGAAR